MLDLLTTPAPRAAPPPLPPPHLHSGPSAAALALCSWRWLAAALDEIDYGIVLLGADGLVRHANRCRARRARRAAPAGVAAAASCARRQRRRAGACRPALHDAAAARTAAADHSRRGRRRQASVSVVPLAVPGRHAGDPRQPQRRRRARRAGLRAPTHLTGKRGARCCWRAWCRRAAGSDPRRSMARR